MPGDPRVQRAVDAAVKFLYGARDSKGRWAGSYDSRFPGGTDSLVLTALLESGRKADQEELAEAIKSIRAAEPATVYARAVRAMAYARLGPEGYGKELAEDAAWLTDRQNRKGGWGYGPGHPKMRRRPAWVDTSNTTFAMLALADAAQAGVEVKPGVWQKAAAFWAQVQNSDGGWGYQPAGGTGLRLRGSSFGSMTAAGVTSLLLAREHLASSPPSTAPPGAESITRALKWLGDNYKIAEIPKWGWGKIEYWPYFYLYCLARAGMGAGLARLGGNDWQGELLGHLLACQSPDGAWRTEGEDDRHAVIRTCFALLAVNVAGAPVLVNKLSVAGADGADVAGLGRGLARAAGRSVCGRALAPDASQRDIESAPILYIDARKGLKIPDELVEPVRRFVLGGGLVLVAAPADDPGAARTAQDKLLSMFRDYQYQARKLPRDHPAFTISGRIDEPRWMQVVGIGDGCRSRVFLVGGNVADAWKRGNPQAAPGAFKLVANLARYSGIDLARPAARARVASRPDLPVVRGRVIAVGRLKHDGDWHIAPLALRPLHHVLAGALSIGVKNVGPVDAAEAISGTIPLLWMTGTRPGTSGLLGESQRKNLAEYLEGGGMIFIDSGMGRADFARQAAHMLADVLGAGSVTKIPPDHPLLTGKFAGGVGADVSKVQIRTADGAAALAGALHCVERNGRLVAVVSDYAVTVPLEGLPAYGCVGLSADEARRLAANIALYAAWQRSK